MTGEDDLFRIGDVGIDHALLVAEDGDPLSYETLGSRFQRRCQDVPAGKVLRIGSQTGVDLSRVREFPGPEIAVLNVLHEERRREVREEVLPGQHGPALLLVKDDGRAREAITELGIIRQAEESLLSSFVVVEDRNIPGLGDQGEHGTPRVTEVGHEDTLPLHTGGLLTVVGMNELRVLAASPVCNPGTAPAICTGAVGDNHIIGFRRHEKAPYMRLECRRRYNPWRQTSLRRR